MDCKCAADLCGVQTLMASPDICGHIAVLIPMRKICGVIRSTNLQACL